MRKKRKINVKVWVRKQFSLILNLLREVVKITKLSEKFQCKCVVSSARVLIVCIMLLSAGCNKISEIKAFGKPYLEPSKEKHDVAFSRITSDGLVVLIPGSNCIDFEKAGSGMAVSNSWALLNDTTNNNKKIGVMGSAPKVGASTELLLKADEPIAISYTYSYVRNATEYACRAMLSFTPDKNAHYQITAATHKAIGRCGIKVSALSGNNRKVETLPAEYCR